MVGLDTFTLHISRDKYYLRYEWFVNSFLIRSLGINNTDECIIKLEIIKSLYLINISIISYYMRWIKDWDEISRKEEGNINAIRIYIYIFHVTNLVVSLTR